MLAPAERPKGARDQNYVVFDDDGAYYRVRPGKGENTLLTQKTGPNVPVLHDFSDVQRLSYSEDLTFGRHYSDKRLNGRTFVIEDGEGRFYNPESECFVPAVDDACVMTFTEANDIYCDQFSDLDVKVQDFSDLKIELFLMKEDPDVKGELIPAEGEEDATKFNVIVRVDYFQGSWAQSGQSETIEAQEGLDFEFAGMYVNSVKQSYPGTTPVVMLMEPEDTPDVRLG